MSINNFSIQVVVSGQAVTEKVNEHQTLDHVVREALQASGNQGQNPDAWDLRTAAGAILPLNQTVEQAGVTAGALLYLNPKTSSGG
jgi:uncharacterized protein DUF2604